MKEKPNAWWPMVLMLVVFAVSRAVSPIPALSNFSAVYGLVFCVGVFFGSRIAWGWTFGIMLLSDLALNCFYQFVRGYEVFTAANLGYQGMNYVCYLLLWGLGRLFKSAGERGSGGGLTQAARSWLVLLGGGLFGAVLFYFITNTASWFINPFRNPEYTKDLAGWLIALSKGTAGFPPTWEFFRNTLLSGGLFTGLFAATALWSARFESAREKETANAPAESEEAVPEPETEEAKA